MATSQGFWQPFNRLVISLRHCCQNERAEVVKVKSKEAEEKQKLHESMVKGKS